MPTFRAWASAWKFHWAEYWTYDTLLLASNIPPTQAWGDAWGGLFIDWDYGTPQQPETSSGVGSAGRQAGRGEQQQTATRFFSYPNIIDDGNLPFLPPTPKVQPRKVAKYRPSVEQIDENDPDIQRMRQAMELRRFADQPPTGDKDLFRISEWIKNVKR